VTADVHPPSSASLRVVRRLDRIALAAVFVLIAFGSAGPARGHESDPIVLRELTRQLSASRPPSALLLRRAELRRIDHDWDGAAEDLDRAEALDPEARGLELCRGALALDRGDAAAAERSLTRELERDPRNGEASWLRARARLALGRRSDAARDMDAALARLHRVTPEHWLARAALAESLESEGPAAALALIERGLDALGPAFALESRAVGIEAGLGRTDDALARLDRMAAASARRASLLAWRGDLLAAAGRRMEACVSWSNALQELDARAAAAVLPPADAALRQRVHAALVRASGVPEPDRGGGR